MVYYILMPGDTESDCVYDSNKLGQIDNGKFYPNVGFKVLNKIITLMPYLLDNVIIKDSQGNTISIDNFLDIISVQ